MDQRTVPRPRSIRVDGLGLTSTEAFVLSQINGDHTLDEVADSTGVPLEKVIAIALRLEELGAIERHAAPTVATSGRYTAVASTPPRKSLPPDGATLAQVPRRTGADVYAMTLERGDAFLLSNVDGRSSIQELADILGDDSARVLERVEALRRAGALELGPPRKASVPRARAAPKVAEPPPRGGASHERRASRSSRKLKAAPPVPGAKGGRSSQPKLRAAHDSVPRHAVLEDPKVSRSALPTAPPPKDDSTCDLSPELIARIEAALATPEGANHYALLGVPPVASAKDISRAYFARVAALHPDRYFGKRLGPYKKKLEDAFRTVCEAYEVLRSASRRLEYDAYLKLRRKSVEMEAALAAPPAPASIPPAPASAPPPRPPAASVPAPAPSVPAAAATPAPPAAPVIVERERAMAPTTPTLRPRPAPSITTLAPPPSHSSPPSAPSARRLVATAKSASLLSDAKQALAQGDAISAANLYRLALQYADDAASRALAQSGLDEARSMVADTHLKRALYEEKEARWSEAVASYEKALDRRPDDPAICERLANALRQEGQDLLRATRLAELAVSRTPRNAAYRRTLGLIYGDAGLREKATEQLEKAVALDPSDEPTNRALATLRKRRG